MRRVSTLALSFVAAGTSIACTPSADAQAPDLIFHDAVVLTMDPDAPVAQALAVTGERITAVGRDKALLRLAGPDTTVVDLGGLTVTPGFIDSHGHWIGDPELAGVSTADEAMQMALEGGWTSINELYVRQERLDELVALDAARQLRVRVNVYLPVNAGPDKFGFWFSDLRPGEQLGPRLRLAGAKFFIDSFGTGYLTEPRHEGSQGEFWWQRGELRRLVAKVHRAGWQIAAHTCGDAATDEIMDALELAYGAESAGSSRDRLEHLFAVRDDQLTRMQRLGVLPSIQLTHMNTQWLRSIELAVAPDRLQLFGRWRDMADDPGLHTIGGTDTPYGEASNPRPTSVMNALEQGTTRRARPGDTVPPWMREQQLSLDQALRLLTTGGAYGIFAEDDLGAIAPGMLADLVVLSEDPHEVPLADLQRIDVAMVFVGGSLEVCASGYEGLCP